MLIFLFFIHCNDLVCFKYRSYLMVFSGRFSAMNPIRYEIESEFGWNGVPKCGDFSIKGVSTETFRLCVIFV